MKRFTLILVLVILISLAVVTPFLQEVEINLERLVKMSISADSSGVTGSGGRRLISLEKQKGDFTVQLLLV